MDFTDMFKKDYERKVQRFSGGYSDRVPPLPIPNREVKPISADGTTLVGE